MTSGARADIDIGELRLGDDLGGQRLLVLRDRLGIVDPHQHRACGDVLPAIYRNIADPPVDPRRDVEPRGINLALHQQRLGAHQIPDRQHGDGGDQQADNDRREAGGERCRALWLFLRRLLHSLRLALRRLHLHSGTFLLLFAAADQLLPCICSRRSVEVNRGTTALICSAPAAGSFRRRRVTIRRQLISLCP